MRTSLKITNNLNLLSEMENDSVFQILEYDELRGSKDIELAVKLDFMKNSGIKLKQVRIILDESAIQIESGALSYMKGQLEIKNKIGGPIGLTKKIFDSKVTGETVFKPTIVGSGEVFLEPSFSQFALVELQDDEIIVDDKMFVACEDGIKVGAVMQKSISSMILGNEGAFQTKISGNGIVVLEIPVPEEEIFKCTLNDDELKVDGNFAILRTGDIEFTVEKSNKSLLGTAASGEGFLNVYRGTGDVWLVPTKSIYEKLSKNNEKVFNSYGSSGQNNTNES